MAVHKIPPDPFDLALIGAGKAGSSVAAALVSAGHSAVAVASRTPASAARGASLLGCRAFSTRELPPAHVYLLGVPDAHLPDVAREVGEIAPDDAVLVHLAGSFGVEQVARASGRSLVAALHPVQAFASMESSDRLPGSAWGVTSPPSLREWAERTIERDLRGIPYWVDERDRALWHAAAVMTSNALAAVVVAGADLLDRLGVIEPSRVLSPLARGALANVEDAGAGADAITGPVVRGEPATIARHLTALDERAPQLRAVYSEVTRMIVSVAVATGRIDAATEAALLEELART